MTSHRFDQPPQKIEELEPARFTETPGQATTTKAKNVMKDLIQYARTVWNISGRILTLAVFAATSFMCATPAQADPGHGAVVTHIDRDRAGWFYTESADGQMRLDVILSGQGDFVRRNPNGTWTLQLVEPKAPMTVSVKGDDGSWVPIWVGNGSFHNIFRAVPTPDGSAFDSTGEDDHLHVQAKLTNLLDGSKWSLHVVAQVVDYQVKSLKIELQPQ